MSNSTVEPRQLLNLNQTASAKPGAIHTCNLNPPGFVSSHLQSNTAVLLNSTHFRVAKCFGSGLACGRLISILNQQGTLVPAMAQALRKAVLL